MQDAYEDVLSFHQHNGYAVEKPLEVHVTKVHDRYYSDLIRECGNMLLNTADRLQRAACESQAQGDCRLYRAALMMEELGETLIALANKDIIETADGLTDLLYVVVGTFVTFGLPMAKLFEEVHDSNMTKKPPTSDDPRMRDKGTGYKPPDIEGVLKIGRWLRL